jgi:hypothetical protein
MDTAVALVQAYLHVNGYFTVAEHPVLESMRGNHVRTVTDLDILAYRLPGAGDDLLHRNPRRAPQRQSPDVDPALCAPAGRADMIVGEVKQGPARLKQALRDAGTLEVALARFGCCPVDESRDVSRRLLSHGRADTSGGHEIRVVPFGDTPDRLGVMSRHVGQSTDGWLGSDRGVDAVVIVEVQPSRQLDVALLG